MDEFLTIRTQLDGYVNIFNGDFELRVAMDENGLEVSAPVDI